jgi:hypothetical protein
VKNITPINKNFDFSIALPSSRDVYRQRDRLEKLEGIVRTASRDRYPAEARARGAGTTARPWHRRPAL